MSALVMLLLTTACSPASTPKHSGSQLAAAIAQSSDPLGREPGLVPEANTRFERKLRAELSKRAVLHEDQEIGPAYNNARGIRVTGGDAVIADVAVWGRKIGVSLDDTEDVLIKNFAFTHRRSMDPYGAGISIGGAGPTIGRTYIGDIYIDLKEPGPNPDYSVANNEPISVERGNGPVSIRKAILLGGEDAAIDAKSDVDVDASFLASGHRTLRIWGGSTVTISNSIILAFPGYSGIWLGEGQSRFRYYNCLFGEVGAPRSALVSDPPEWMIVREAGAGATPESLAVDPFDRSDASFWVPAAPSIPNGYLVPVG